MGLHPPSWFSCSGAASYLEGVYHRTRLTLGVGRPQHGLLPHHLGGSMRTVTIREAAQRLGNVAGPHFPLSSRTARPPAALPCVSHLPGRSGSDGHSWLPHFSIFLLCYSNTHPDLPLGSGLSYLFSIISKPIIQ